MDNNIRLKTVNPKSSANLFSILTFIWMTKLCYKSVKESLKVDDLYENLPADKSDKLSDTLEKCWFKEVQCAKESSTKPSLFVAIRKTFFLHYMCLGTISFLQMVVFRTIQPVLLLFFIGLFSKKENTKDAEEKMFIYGGLIVAVSLVLLLIEHNINFHLTQAGMRVRIACCSLVYRKVLRLSKQSLNKSPVGQVVNLLSNDVGRFDIIAPLFHYLWIMPIQAAIVTYLLWWQLGYAAFVGVGSLVLLTIPVHVYLGKIISSFRLKVAQRTDSRVKKMAEIISGIQVIKMYGWENSFSQIVNIARAREIKILTWVSYVRGVVTSSFVFIERSILFITIISYVLFGNIITPDKVFSTAQFYNLLQLALAIYFPLGISAGAEVLVSIKRLDEFLMLEENQESEIKRDRPNGILLKNVYASWDLSSEFLKDINIQLPSGSLCAIVGPVGSGKTSLLQVLLGELTPRCGSIEIGGDLSYSSQEAWLFASTVRKNILFGQKYDPKRYEQVIKVCALERDFELLPYGDKSLVGEKGVSLSGGQKARINLARAVYRQAEVYLLDDPLSAVDTHVGKHLYEKCIVNYLRNKTRIIVTHQLQYLKNVDYIIVMNSGKIEITGSFNELLSSNCNFTKMLITDDEIDAAEEDIKNNFERSIRKLSKFSNLSEVSTVLSDEDKEEKAVEEELGQVGASIFFQYARAGGNVCTLLLVVFLFIAAQAISNASDLWLTYWTQQNPACSIVFDHLLENPEVLLLNQSLSFNENTYFYQSDNSTYVTNSSDCEEYITVYTAIYVYAGLILGCIVILLTRSFCFYKTAMNASRNLHNKMFSSLLRAPMRFYNINPSGRILNRFSRDIGMIDEILPRLMLEAAQIFFVMVGILVMVFITNVYMIIVALILSVAFYKLREWYLIIARNIKHLEGITKSPVFSHVNASLNGLTTVRASHMESTLIKEFDLHQDTHTSAWYLMIAVMSSFGLWIDFLSFIFVACVTFGFIVLSQNGGVEGSQVGLAISQSLILTGMVQYGMRQAAEVISQMTSVERVLEYTKVDQETPQETSIDKTLNSWPSHGQIQFKHVSLRYAEHEEPVLKNLNFIVESGEKIGIVGRTGAGKSSLIAALFRLAPLEGTITIDGIDMQTIGLTHLRKHISIIPQEPVLFSASLRYNLDPFDEYSDAEIWKVLDEVELKSFVNSLEFLVQEGGNNFSVGQRQLLCLARAILRNNKILVLDEATANVDPKTDELIQNAIRKKFKACTVLTVAHRLHTIMDSDKVLVMDAGYLVEYDHPHILLQNTNGYLSKLVEETGATMAAQLHEIAKNIYAKTEDSRL